MRLFKLLLILSGLLLFNACDSKKDSSPVSKSKLKKKTLAPIILSDISRSPDGRVRNLEHVEAERYCKSINGRLPTPRELAEGTTAAGMLVLDTAHPGVPRNDMRLVDEYTNLDKEYATVYEDHMDANNSPYQTISFYYNSKNFKPSQVECKTGVPICKSSFPLWTSQKHFYEHGIGWITFNTNEDSGWFSAIPDWGPNADAAVRCVID